MGSFILSWESVRLMASITVIDAVPETIRVRPYAVPVKTLVLPVKPASSTFRAQEGTVAA